MNDSVRETLKKLVAQYGVDLCANRQRLEGLLRDFCGQHRGEIAVLVAAVREGVAADLLKVSGAQVDALLFHRLVRRLCDDAGIAQDNAEWAVNSWAYALQKTLPQQAQRRRSDGANGSAGASPSRPPANAQRGDTWTNPNDGAVMIYIPAGEFLMGSNDGDDDEKPQHRVYLDGYWIYKYEVTVAQYRKFCRATGREMPKAPPWGWKDDHPIVNVTWHDAVAYCDWAGVRLPTEAEWEKAARGTDGRKYPWGNEWDGSKCANSVGSNNLFSTVPVGSYPQGVSPYGVHDMAGNVWEWCSSLYEPYPYRADDGREERGKNVAGGARRVLRGGSWHYDIENDFRTPNRNRNYPDYRWYYNGFRCAARSDFR
jgi:formylglycine-generating enzyme required for sulfatase activity